MLRSVPAAGVLLTLGLSVLAACSTTASSSVPDSAARSGSIVRQKSISAYPICQSPKAKTQTQCGGIINALFAPNPNQLLSPFMIPGLHPGDVQSAYGLTQVAKTNGAGKTVAIVTAYSDPFLAVDLGIYRTAFGLPPCGLLNGCLKILNPLGQPLANSAWGTETSLDAEMVSAACPNCSITIVAAKDDKVSSLAAAASAAAASGATVISNSYAAPETAQNVKYESAYAQSGIAVVAGAGDGGYSQTAVFPASSPHVTAVGGTSLTLSGSGWQQSVWPGTGSGCSAYFAKPKWQTDGGCAMRTDNDVAAVADPNTGVAVWSLYAGGWVVVGGTSVATPIVGAMYALAGNTAGMHDASGLYADPAGFASITGSNGTCKVKYLCNAGPGYSGPAGLGVPLGVSAF